MRKLTKVNRLRYKEYFQDFDPLRKGNVKRNKFRSVVHQTMKLGLDDRVLDRLEAYYRNSEDPTLVDYMRFLDDIDIVFTLPVLRVLFRNDKRTHYKHHLYSTIARHTCRTSPLQIQQMNLRGY